MEALHDNVAFAIDGGGIKGLIAAQGLVALEDQLGAGPLINNPKVKVLAGTSTGALITAGIALGLSAKEIVQVYIDTGQAVFPALTPSWVPAGIAGWYKILLGLLRPSLYSGDKLKEVMRKIIGDRTGNPDLTYTDLKKRLRSDQALIITTVDIEERRTHFLKSYDDSDGGWMLWEAVLASCAAPVALPVVVHNNNASQVRYFTDGGVGNYGNPAYVAVREMIEWQSYKPETVSVFSFGTGWVGDSDFDRAHGAPTKWRILDWAMNSSLLLLGDAERAQSIDIIQAFVTQGMDLRRFQVTLKDDIESDAFASNATLALLQQMGMALGQRILNDQHALCGDPTYDPEGIYDAWKHYQASKPTTTTTSVTPAAQ